jgi:mannosyltransferase
MRVLPWKVIACLLFITILEVIFHVRDFAVTRPSTNLDAPFRVGCLDGVQNTTARANATFMMLARNSDVNSAVASVESVQRQFNDRFGYPWVFLNDEPWTPGFIEKVTKAVGEGLEAHFDTILKDMWDTQSGLINSACSKVWMTCRAEESYMLVLKVTTICVVSTQGL